MRLVVCAAVLALWTAENPSTADAFSMQPRQSHSGLSITTMPPSSLYMSTIERPMTAPGSPNSYSGHPFGSYGKPDKNGDESSYSYGPSNTPPPPGSVDKSIAANNSNIHNNQYSRGAPADSFQSYMQGRNNNSNPSSPSDNYNTVDSSNSNNFGAPSTPTSPPPPSNNSNNSNNNNNFGAPPSTPAAPAPAPNSNSNNSFASFATSGGATGNTGSRSNFGAPSTPPPAAPRPNSYSSPPPPQQANNNFGAPSTHPPAAQNPNSYSPPPPPVNNNFGAPSTTAPAPPAAPQQNSFEAYMNSRSNNSNSNSNNNNSSSPPFPGSPASSSISNSNSNNDLNSRIAAAADPNSPLPPYMSPSSLENGNTRSANLPGSPGVPGRPEFRPPMPGMETQPQRSVSTSTSSTPTTTAPTTAFQQQGPQIAPPLSAPLARVGVPNVELDIGLPSEVLVGRLDQVLTQQQEFAERLDRVDEKIDRTTQENIERTQAMLTSFKHENEKTQETFMNRINGDIRGMRSTMDKVLGEQRDLLQKQQDQSAKFAALEKSRSEQAEKLLTLEKTTSIRAQNIEQNLSQAAVQQAQRLDSLERNAAGGGNNNASGVGGGTPDANSFELERRQNERMSNFERAQIERMAAFEEEQRLQLENALREYQQSYSPNNNNNNNNNGPNSGSGNGNNPMNSGTPNYNTGGMNQQRNDPQRHIDETERVLQQRLNEAQARKEELLAQLEEMQRQEELYKKGGRGSHEDPHSRDGVPPPPPYASRLDQQMNNQQQDAPRSRFGGDSPDDFDGMRQPRFEEEDEDEVVDEPPRRMMRDRLGKASGEQLYSRNVGGNPRRNLSDDDKKFDGDAVGDRRMRMDPEEERRMQHERMMRRDPVTPPEAMGPPSRQPGSPAGRYDPRRGGPFGSEQDEIAYDISKDSSSSVRQTLGNMRSFKGDDQVPKKSIFDGSGGVGVGGIGSMDRRGSQSQQPQKRRVPANQGQMGRQQQQQQQQQPEQRRPGAKECRAGLSEPPPPNPLVDKKIEHFLMETLKSGPKPHFEKELESLLIIKYSPLFSWLKPANVTFLRNVLVTFLQHKGCQVEMNIRSASPKAAREWEELLNILSFELEQRTGEKPKIMEEPENQWGIYGSKDTRLRVSGNNPLQQREQSSRRGGGLTPEEAARRKMRNDKAFRVSNDPTDPTKRLL